MKKDLTITEFILDFQQSIKTVSEIFYSHYNRKDLLSAWHDGTIPKQGANLGKIDDYSFHGSGLYARIGKVEVDFDFGLNERIDGFDAWRLWHFARLKKETYPYFQEEDKIQSELDMLVREKKIVKPGEYPGRTNYYWIY